jgi:AcrR family transcriptional regulator
MATQRHSGDERRREILRAATELIGRDGLAGLTAATLAGAVGLTPGALYKHFDSLDDVLGALALDVEAALEATLPPEHVPPLEWLERFVEQRRTTVGGSPGVLRLLLSERFSAAFPTQARAPLTRAVRRTVEAVAATLARGQARGVIRTDVAPAALAPVVLGLTQFLAFAGLAGEAAVPAAARTSSALLTLLNPVPGAPPSDQRKRHAR